MSINMSDLMNSFLVMGQGMAGIFIVLIVISLVVLLLSKATNKKSSKKED